MFFVWGTKEEAENRLAEQVVTGIEPILIEFRDAMRKEMKVMQDHLDSVKHQIGRLEKWQRQKINEWDARISALERGEDE